MKIKEENVAMQLRKRNEKALYFIIDRYGGLYEKVLFRSI